MTEKFEKIIRPKSGWFDIDFKELWKYRDLVKMFIKRNLVVQYKQTVLGPLWLIISPIVSSIVFTFVFGRFAGLQTDGLPQFLFYMSGNTIWGLFASCVNGTSNTFSVNSAVFGKVYFPRLTVPISQALFSIINFFIQFAILLIMTAYFMLTGTAFAVGARLWLLPVIILQTACFGLGVGIIISSLTTKYRDLVYASTFVMQLWMYVTPVVYSIDETGGYMRSILMLNPMTPMVTNFRNVLFGSGTFLTGSWYVSLAVTAVVLFVGLLLFNRMEKNFMDTI